jgi:hypothetical protein
VALAKGVDHELVEHLARQGILPQVAILRVEDRHRGRPLKH